MSVRKLEILIGSKYGKLTVIKELERLRIPSGQTNRVFLCKCECGNTTKVRLVHLSRGRTLSCGCLVGDKSGDSHRAKLYNSWRAMINRCTLNYFQKHLYSDKKITVCDDWRNSYLSFKTWALNNGFKEGLCIDRIDNSKGYYPENCRWVTNLVNANNKDNTFFIIYKGVKRPLKEVLREVNKSGNYATIGERIKRGWDHTKAVDTKIREGNYSKTNFHNNK
jgi:hypothetical protein